LKGKQTYQMKQVVLMLGSNIADRKAYLTLASAAIESRIGKVEVASSIYETAPWGTANQTAYLNQLLVVQSNMEPLKLMDALLGIEQELGRRRSPSLRWEDRTIDIDIVYIGNECIAHERLHVPHPRLAERRFVLVPLCEVLPDFIHPKLRMDTKTLLQKTTDTSNVKKVN
jgi:2-amino-4-hydroxy-6-hydroxymethyldihydropteridine diphosphokinase